MKRFLLTILMSLGLAGTVVSAPIPLWENYGTIYEAPQIDAVAFLNAGTMYVYSSLPFDTQNTRYFTNRGTMYGMVGFRFDYVSDMGRKPAAFFENQQSITAADYSGIYYSSASGGASGYSYSLSSFLLVSATNIVNRGYLAAGANGLVRLEGKNVDLRNSGISATESASTTYGSSIGLGATIGTNYINPMDVSDLYWGIGTDNVLGGNNGTPLFLGGGAFDPPYPRSPSHEVLDIMGYTNIVTVPSFFFYLTSGLYLTNVFGMTPYLAYAYTNMLGPSNAIVQVVFVPTNAFDTNLSVQVRFSGGAGGAARALVELSVSDVDVVTDLPITNYIYLVDSSAVQTNTFYQVNLGAATFRPSAYRITRATPTEWFLSVPSNTVYSPSLIVNSNYALAIITNVPYSGYAASIGQVGQPTNYNTLSLGIYYGSMVQNPALTDPTNFPGRIELIGCKPDLTSDQLDLTGTRIRCEGLFSIKTKNLLGSTGAKLDSPLFSVDLGNTNSALLVSNLFPSTVKRMQGEVYAWSAIWTNQSYVLSITNDPTMTNLVVNTNTIDVKFHVLMVDHTVQSERPVTINEFITRGTNVTVANDVRVARNLLVDSPCLTVQGQFSVPGGLGSTNLPRMLSFTNDTLGYLYVPLQGNFGWDRAQPWDNLVNYGYIYGGGHKINVRNFVNQGAGWSYWTNLLGTNVFGTNIVSPLFGLGTIAANSGALLIKAESALLDNSQLWAFTDVNLQARDLRAQYSTIQAGSIYQSYYTNSVEIVNPGSLTLSVTNQLADGGPGASNLWRCVGNLQLLAKPKQGDLLGTRIETVAPKFAIVKHLWAAEDRGATTTGFTNNAALGWLVLNGRPYSQFDFGGTGASNALYVDYLELRNNATNYTTALNIQPNMRIYFANANLPPEKLNGRFGGRLRWVSSFAGPNSSTNLVMPSGKVYAFNSVLAQSEELDSDGDGVINRLDPMPFYTDESVGLTMQLANLPTRTAVFSWVALANSANYLEFKGDLGTSNWQVMTNFVQGPSTARVTAQMPLPRSSAGFYRIRVELPQQ